MTVEKKARAINAKTRTFFAARVFAVAVCFILNGSLVNAQNSGQGAVSLYAQGMEFLEERAWWDASEKFQEALKANPSYADAWFRLSQCLYQMDSPDAALDTLQSAKKYAPGRSDILNLEGLCLISLGRLDEAQKIFEDVQKKFPNDIDSRFGLAELNLFRGRVSGAESIYSDALRRNPGNAKALLSLSLISAELGKTRQAERFVNQAIQTHADNPQVYYVASYLDFKAGDIESAEKRCLSAIQVYPDYFEAYELLALIYFRQGRFEQVIDLADWAISRDRSGAASWYLKGLALHKQNKDNEAINTWLLGLEAVPQDEVMRAAFELLISQNIDLEDERRKDWAQYHVDKGSDYGKKYAGVQMRYEYQAALRVDPLNYRARSAFSRLLRGQGFGENYLAQIKFIQENEILQDEIARRKNSGREISADQEKTELVRLSDTVEGYESLLENTLASKWNVNPFYLDKSRWSLGLYYLPTKEPLLHPELARVFSQSLSVLFRGLLGTSVRAVPKAASSYGEAYADARKNGYDYFVLIDAKESERDVIVTAEMNSARTGTLTQSLSVFKTGNNRFASALLSMRQGILDVLPMRALLLERSGNDVLVDIGKTEGVVKGAKFAVVRRGALKTADNGRGLRFEKDDLLGSVELTNVSEDISEGVLSGAGFYDRVNARDELIFPKSPKEEAPASAPPSAPPPAADQNGSPYDGNEIEAAVADPLRGANEKSSRIPELVNMIKKID